MQYPIFFKALDLAVRAHDGQYRKFGKGVPYIVHPIAVAKAVGEVMMPHEIDTAMAAAVCHDVLEDTAITEYDMRESLGSIVTDVVKQVSKVSTPEDGNRAVRKAKDRNHYINAGYIGATIKIADCIDNMKDIMLQAPDFAKVYMREKRDLVPFLGGNLNLKTKAIEMINTYFKLE